MIIVYTSSEGIANTVVKEEIRYNWKTRQNRAYVCTKSFHCFPDLIIYLSNNLADATGHPAYTASYSFVPSSK